MYSTAFLTTLDVFTYIIAKFVGKLYIIDLFSFLFILSTILSILNIYTNEYIQIVIGLIGSTFIATYISYLYLLWDKN